MGEMCLKPMWKNRCCCGCQYQRVIVKHPWNKGVGEGPVTERMGFGCEPPDYMRDGKPVAMFRDSEHGLCEMHEEKHD